MEINIGTFQFEQKMERRIFPVVISVQYLKTKKHLNESTGELAVLQRNMYLDSYIREDINS